MSVTANTLRERAALISSPVETRLFSEYGASFVTTATPPPVIVFADKEQVELFQSSLVVGREVFGEHSIELQAEAIEALKRAALELLHNGRCLTARAADAGRRSFEETVKLWARNVTRGLEHWEEEGRLEASRATAIRSLAPVDQVGLILEMEDTEQLYCGTYFNRSILYSVAAPGASQHLSMLAFDVAEYQDPLVERALETHGWFRTVVNDLPHFSYLGRRENQLAGLGLKRVIHTYGEIEYHFWIPDL